MSQKVFSMQQSCAEHQRTCWLQLCLPSSGPDGCTRCTVSCLPSPHPLALHCTPWRMFSAAPGSRPYLLIVPAAVGPAAAAETPTTFKATAQCPRLSQSAAPPPPPIHLPAPGKFL